MIEIPILENVETPLPDKMQQSVSIPTVGHSDEGWWNHSLKGSKEGVQKALVADGKTPGFWIDAIFKDIDDKCGTENNFIVLDVHYFKSGNKVSMHYSLVVSKVL